jgi:hypothetical protein
VIDHDSLGPPLQIADAQPPPALRDALVAAISRRRRRTRFRLAVTAGALVAAAAIVLAGGVFSSGPARVLAVDTDGSWVSVQVIDGQAGAAEMTSELQKAGINGEVKLLPATPDLVGEWMGVQVVNESQPQCGSTLPPGLSCANAPLLDAGEAQMDGDALRIRSDAANKLSGKQLVFYLGRAPQPGEEPRDGPPGH